MFYLLKCWAFVTRLMCEAYMCDDDIAAVTMVTAVLTLGSKDTSAIFLNRSIVTDVVSAKLLIPLSYNICTTHAFNVI